MKENIQLSIGEEYQVQLYPKKEIVRARYMGKAELKGFGDRFLFISEDKEKSYITMRSNWLIKKEDGTLSYTSVSSASISKITKKGLRDLLDSEDKINRDFGMRISNFLENFGERL
jgi:hypothetical protein